VKHRSLDDARTRLTDLSMAPSMAAKHGWQVNQDGRKRTAFDYLAYPSIGFDDLVSAWPDLGDIAPEVAAQMEIEAQYAGYLDRQAADVAAMRRDEALHLPEGIDYSTIGGLSNEVRAKLEQIRPRTLGQASRIEGMTPGALTALLGHVKGRGRTASGTV